MSVIEKPLRTRQDLKLSMVLLIITSSADCPCGNAEYDAANVVDNYKSGEAEPK